MYAYLMYMPSAGLALQAPDTGKTMRKLRGSEAAKLTVSGMVSAKRTELAIMLRAPCLPNTHIYKENAYI